MRLPIHGAAMAAPTGALWPTLGILGVLAIVVSVPALHMTKEWSAMRKDKEAWTISGPACAIASDAGRTSRELRTFDYGGASFSRRAGNVYCATLGEGLNMDRHIYRVCQFNAPVRVSVTADGKTTFFNPGPGRPATVVVRNGQVSCVKAAWFKW